MESKVWSYFNFWIVHEIDFVIFTHKILKLKGYDDLLFAPLRGYCTPNQKIACFVLYLKIINTLFSF